MVKVSSLRVEDPGFDSCLCRKDFSRSSHTSDFKTGTPVTTMTGAWRYRFSVRIGWPRVSILWLGEIEKLIWNLYLIVAACQLVWADPCMRYASMLLGSRAINKQQIPSNQLNLSPPRPSLTYWNPTDLRCLPYNLSNSYRPTQVPSWPTTIVPTAPPTTIGLLMM